jgi:multidrug efflux pump
MTISTPFIRRPVATTLLTIALALAGMLAYTQLPVSPLPQVEFPTIQVQANLPGASPETMASAVATPLERQFGRIAGVTEMTSSSSTGNSQITLQFDLNRNIDAAGRDVQAAINAARSQLPANLPGNPSYKKVNPADAPILILTLTSDIYPKARMYDVATSVLEQKLSQVEGVGQVGAGGSANPAVRVDVNPTLVNNMGLGLDDIRTALNAANANRPKGQIVSDTKTWTIATTDQLLKADQYKPLVVAYRKGSAVRLGDIATVTDSVEDVRNAGLADGKPSVLLFIFRQPGANIIDTVDRVRALLPQFRAEIPAGMNLNVAMDRTTTIRASFHDVQMTLLISVILVILVVFFFLRDGRTTLIPSVAVPISLIGTFGVMYLCGYTLDNLSLMALTIATGFVVDDAIVVIENVTRHLEAGMEPQQAAVLGAKEIGFTVLSMSVSLVAVFIPLLLMGGIVGRLFREFAVTLSVAIGVSLIVSLTTTPMMCATLLRHRNDERHNWFYRVSESMFDGVHSFYEFTLRGVLRHPLITMFITIGTVILTVYLYIIVPKGFFPQQDTGRLMGQIQADQSTSFQAMEPLLTRFAKTVSEDESVDNVIAFVGGSSSSGRMFVSLKPLNERKTTVDDVMASLRRKLGGVPGARLYLQPVQDLRIGGRSSNAQFQYSLQGDDLTELNTWVPKMVAQLQTIPDLVDVSSDQQVRGLEAQLVIDRATASRLGVSPQQIDDALYDAFGQRQVSTMYLPLNQYHVVMEANENFTQNPDGLKHIFVHGAGETRIPLSAITHYAPSNTPLSVNHQGQFPAITISFNLRPGVSLGDAVLKIEQAGRDIGLPASIHGSFAGTAQAFQASLASQPVLIIFALLTVYIVLGMLYESFVHPITILSTLPSAGVGALLALLIFRIDLTVIALIGIILLIGIVKKNAIMMIDFAVDVQRRENRSPQDAIFQACLLRFRPIMMTTMAALLGGLPLALGNGTGSEFRRPLGIAIVGGLVFSQMLTLYTTPVVYLYLDRLRLYILRIFRGPHHVPVPVIPIPDAGV